MSQKSPPIRVPEDLRAAGPFSPVVVVPAGDLVVVSGQGPLDGDNNLVGETIEEQTASTIERCRRLLEAAGAGLEDVFKVSVYLTDLALWPRFNEAYKTAMPVPLPARTAVGTDLLMGMMVELEMWAVRRPS